MNLKKSGKMVQVAVAVAILAMVLQGCGGGDDGVNRDLHDQLQIDHDALVEALATANTNVTSLTTDIGMDPTDDAPGTGLKGDLATEKANVASLTTDIGMDPTDDAPGTGLKGDLATEKANVASLTTDIGMDPTDDAPGTGLKGDLAMAKANVASLTTDIGMDPTDDAPGTGLKGDLAMAKATVTELKDEIGSMGDEADPDVAASLHAQLNAAKATVMTLEGEIGMDPTDDAAGTGLKGMLATANARVMALEGEIGMDPTDDAAGTGLKGMLATANARVTTLEGEIGMDPTDDAAGTGLKGMLATANARVMALEGEIGSPDDAADASDTASLNAQLKAAKARIAELDADMDPTDLAAAMTAAKTASEMANTASTAANTATEAAKTAAMNRASLQTGEANSYDDYMTAKKHADTAMVEADKAMNAYTAAQEAMTAGDAEDQQDLAEAAQKAAEAAQKAAEAAQKAAEANALLELKIDGKDKSVGTSSLNADDANNSVTINDKTTEVGRLESMDPETMGGPNPGRVAVAKTAGVDYVAPEAGAFAREVALGRVIDSSDDMARLMLITHYAGTKTVKVYGLLSGESMSHKKDTIRLEDGVDDKVGTDDDVLTDLRSVGTFYLAGDDEEGLAVQAGLNQGDPQGDSIAAGGKSAKVYSYVDTEAAGDPTKYVVLKSKLEDDDGITYTYSLVDIHIDDADMDGDGDPDAVFVTADLPTQTAYKHIYFGVWAGLGNPEDDGSQKLEDLGIAFVQSIGDGMTGADMPNNGTANFTGNWVAAIRAEDDDGDGDIVLKSDDATLAANFTKDEIEATLTNLATLTGSISGNTFTGTKVSDVSVTHGLDANGKFDGKFNGAFYGSKAAEAGGIFDFMSEDMEEGAFRGVFGADRDRDPE